jgi:transposase InsO family protein
MRIGYATLRSNQVWVADHHQFDVLVKVGEKLDAASGERVPVYKRPWLTAWMDCRSRELVGWLIRWEDPDTQAIVDCWQSAILACGVPEVAYTDNGKDFKCKIFCGLTPKQAAALFRTRSLRVEHDQIKLGGIYAALGVEHMRAWKYHGQSKPIERFFRTVCLRFSVHFDTYCGRSPDDKPEGLNDRIQQGKCPGFKDFVADFGDWLEADYRHKWHAGDAMEEFPGGPGQAWESCLVTKRTADPQLLEVLCQPRVGPVTVGQNGVTHLGIEFGRGQLSRWFGRKVFLRIRRTLDSVSVWSLDDKEFLGVADANMKLPFLATPADAKAAIQEKRRDTRLLKDAHGSRMRIAESTTDRIARLRRTAAEAQLAAPSTPDPTDPYVLVPVRSDLEAHVKALSQAVEETQLRRAAGAESLTLDQALAAYGGHDEL